MEFLFWTLLPLQLYNEIDSIQFHEFVALGFFKLSGPLLLVNHLPIDNMIHIINS